MTGVGAACVGQRRGALLAWEEPAQRGGQPVADFDWFEYAPIAE